MITRICTTLLLLCWLTSCGRGIIDPTFFDEYLQLFEKESITYHNSRVVTDLVIKFTTTLDDKIAGQCQSGGIATPLILVNVRVWECCLNQEQKEILLFHEMGHCVLGLPHDDTKLAIMNTDILPSYLGNRSGMLAYYFAQNGIDNHAAMRYSKDRKVEYVSYGR